MTTQHFHSPRGCLSYIVWDDSSKEAVVIDPSEEVGQEVYESFLNEKGLTLRYILETHTHADHLSLAGKMHQTTGTPIARHALAPSQGNDIPLNGGEDLPLGSGTIHVLATPGHTNESVSYYTGMEVFTGDALLIGGTGRTDFQVGDSETLYHTLHEVLGALPTDTLVRPGHDYQGRNVTTLGEERKTNPRFLMSKEEFVRFMNDYHPPKPELFDVAIPENSK